MDNGVETTATMTAKATPPVSISIAQVAGVPVSDLLLWATLVYTLLMIGHKVYTIYQEVKNKGGK